MSYLDLPNIDYRLHIPIALSTPSIARRDCKIVRFSDLYLTSLGKIINKHQIYITVNICTVRVSPKKTV